MDSLQAYREFAELLADASREILQEANRGEVRGEAKGDGSPVTVVDQAVEDRIRDMILATFPSHGVVGEERGTSSPESEFVWVIDPIDGTLPFLAGFPVFGTLIALLHKSAPVLGIIDMPATKERWVGCENQATTRNGTATGVRACGDISAALLSTSNPDFYDALDHETLQRLKAATCWTVYGGSCMAYAQIASGRIDLGIDVSFDVFDYLALVPVIQGAGGVITDWQGAPLTLQSGDRFIAAGDTRVHAQALEILSES